MKNIACIIVTYNRKEDLGVCLEAVFHQSYLPSAVYVIDNASTDGTKEWLDKQGFSAEKSKNPHDVEFIYIRMTKNLGGAGGFYTGMKTAYESQRFDGYWVMDDDGIPEPTCLENLIYKGAGYDYIAPMVVDVQNPNLLSFEYMGNTRMECESMAIDGIVLGKACPFNGILYSQKLVEAIGFPKKEMFIWGDEENYNMRAIDAGFNPVTIVTAIHRHPRNRVMNDTSLLGPIDIAPQMWRCYCRYRNAIYNNKNKMTIFGKAYVFINHIWYYLIKKHSVKWTRMYINAFFDGLHSDFTKLHKYMNIK